jgi:translation initiation factor IF-2
MEQRPLRLGDILDDYCPRERRVTNHAVVAMIEEGVKQTRCTTCDTEHVYKGGKAPRRKKSDTTGALYKEVLAGITDQDAPPAAGITAVEAVSGVAADEPAAPPPALVQPPAPPIAIAAAAAQQSAPMPQVPPNNDDIDPDERQPSFDEGPVHRPLIRAQLARPEGIKIERVAPEFTIRQNPNGRGGFRGGSNSGGGGGDMRARGGGGGGGRPGGGGGGSNNGHRFGRGPSRPGGGGGGGRGGGPNQGFGRGPGGAGGGQQRSGRPPKRPR